MSNNFTSPPSNDPIKKLQNLLNNCLYSIMDVLSNLSYKGEMKELEVVSGDLSEYAYFVNLLKEKKNEIGLKLKDEVETGDQVIHALDGEVEVGDQISHALDGEVEVRDQISHTLGGEVQVGNQISHTLGGEVQVGDQISHTLDGEVETGDANDGVTDNAPVEHSCQGDEESYFIKPTFENSLEEEILDRVERMNLILKTIDDCIDELPDSHMVEEEKCQEMNMLQKKKDASKEELKSLYAEYDFIYNYVTNNLRNLVVSTEH
ncbi:large ribosomal subunit processing factor, putative [Plasmodium ovale]|uniref:Large ribosomal subunit processing factor, putative n=1 Tax=Plasmodium ovale TaxID=36330 RepID=A0A1C3KSM3_PLAOA|nr:large ribosomal subunit processing factor, putative [Plasmodium ovale]